MLPAPSAQDRYCVRGLGGGAKKRSGNEEGYNHNSVSQEVCFDKGFIDTFLITVWYKMCPCGHSVLEFQSFSPQTNWWTE